MAEGTYEYECMRAELLGVEKPDYEEFLKKMENEKKAVEEDDLDTENLKEIDLQEESTNRIHGGLEELNSILQKTQCKINRFKASCGSLTNLLKVRITGRSESSVSLNGNAEKLQTEVDTTERTENTTKNNLSAEVDETNSENGSKPAKTELDRALDSNLSKLDIMIEKAENAQYSMAHQSKQMRKFLK